MRCSLATLIARQVEPFIIMNNGVHNFDIDLLKNSQFLAYKCLFSDESIIFMDRPRLNTLSSANCACQCIHRCHNQRTLMTPPLPPTSYLGCLQGGGAEPYLGPHTVCPQYRLTPAAPARPGPDWVSWDCLSPSHWTNIGQPGQHLATRPCPELDTRSMNI